MARAILCCAASVAFNALTPGEELDMLDIPQNTHKLQKTDQESTAAVDASLPSVNMGAVMMSAKSLGLRSIQHATLAAKRSMRRERFSRSSLERNLFLRRNQQQFGHFKSQTGESKQFDKSLYFGCETSPAQIFEQSN